MHVDTDFSITGRLARFGRGGMIQDVSNRLLREFSDCLQQSIEAAPANPAPAASESDASEPGDAGAAARSAHGPRPAAPPAVKPVGGFSLLVRALWDRIGRLFRRER